MKTRGICGSRVWWFCSVSSWFGSKSEGTTGRGALCCSCSYAYVSRQPQECPSDEKVHSSLPVCTLRVFSALVFWFVSGWLRVADCLGLGVQRAYDGSRCSMLSRRGSSSIGSLVSLSVLCIPSHTHTYLISCGMTGVLVSREARCSEICGFLHSCIGFLPSVVCFQLVRPRLSPDSLSPPMRILKCLLYFLHPVLLLSLLSLSLNVCVCVCVCVCTCADMGTCRVYRFYSEQGYRERAQGTNRDLQITWITGQRTNCNSLLCPAPAILSFH